MLVAVAALSLPACSKNSGPYGQRGERPLANADESLAKLDPKFNTAQYDRIYENPFLTSRDNPLSTFSINVDTASYSNVRKFLNEGKLPPADAVRVADFVNYFRYDYQQPDGEHPMAVIADVGACPWNSEHRLVRIGLKGKEIERGKLPSRNLVFLIDVSGSMDRPNRLPLVKAGLNLLVDQLTAQDRVAIVVYAGAAGLVLPPTPGNEKATIKQAITRLNAGGATNGGEGINQAYKVAEGSLIKDGVNRVILATDGDFNVGVTSQGELLRLVEEKRKAGVYLTVLGFGMDNLKDSTLEKLADKGNGHYAYIDTLAEAQKVFVEDGASLVTIAKDVKVQVEFNPKQVGAYRLIGYENRLLKAQDFNDDDKAATPMGAGHTVTALYEIVPAGKKINVPGIDPLKYQTTGEATPAAGSGEVLTVKVRYKEPKENASKLLTAAVTDAGKKLEEMPADFRFAAAAAGFGLVLRDSSYKGDATFKSVQQLAEGAMGAGTDKGHRGEFLKLVGVAESLAQAKK